MTNTGETSSQAVDNKLTITWKDGTNAVFIGTMQACWRNLDQARAEGKGIVAVSILPQF